MVPQNLSCKIRKPEVTVIYLRINFTLRRKYSERLIEMKV